MVEDLALTRSSRGDKVLVKNVKNVLADLSKLRLDLLACRQKENTHIFGFRSRPQSGREYVQECELTHGRS